MGSLGWKRRFTARNKKRRENTWRSMRGLVLSTLLFSVTNLLKFHNHSLEGQLTIQHTSTNPIHTCPVAPQSWGKACQAQPRPFCSTLLEPSSTQWTSGEPPAFLFVDTWTDVNQKHSLVLTFKAILVFSFIKCIQRLNKSQIHVMQISVGWLLRQLGGLVWVKG